MDNSTKKNIDENLPYENRVFVCYGKLKNLRNPHTWIMTIDDNYKDITFWDPRFSAKYELKGRIENPKRLKRFLNRESTNYANLEDEDFVEAPKEESFDENDNLLKKKKNNDLMDDIIPLGFGDEDVYDYNHDSFCNIIEVDDINLKEKDYDMVTNELFVNKTKASNDKIIINILFY